MGFSHIKEQEADSFRKRKMICISAILCLITCAALLIFPLVLAEDDEDEDSGGGGRYFGTAELRISEEDYTKLIKEMSKQYKEFERLDELYSYEDGSLLYSVMEADRSPGKLIMTVTQAFGILLVLLMNWIQVYHMAMREDKSLDTLFRIMLMTLIGLLAVIYIQDIISGIEEFGRYFVKELGLDSYQSADTIVKYEYTEKGSPLLTPIMEFKDLQEAFGNFGAVFFTLVRGREFFVLWGLAYVVGKICLVFTFYAILSSAYGILIEMIIRRIMSPLAVSTLVTDGPRSAFTRYLRGYFAMYLRMALMFIAIGLSLRLQTWMMQWQNATQAFDVHWVLGPLGVCICARSAAKALMVSGGDVIREVIGGQGG